MFFAVFKGQWRKILAAVYVKEPWPKINPIFFCNRGDTGLKSVYASEVLDTALMQFLSQI
jgi:hypothetical protein